jgi:hypothetical protein
MIKNNVPKTTTPPYAGYQVTTGYLVNDGSFWIVPTFNLAPIKAQNFIITLDNLYILNSKLPATLPSNDNFSFAIVSGAQVQITLIYTQNWAANRAALMQNFVGFLQAIETTCELGQTPILAPGSTFRIGQAIADTLPAPLLESIFYRYSFSSGFAAGTKPYVDIRPGMRLRVETQASQFLAAGSTLNGYIAGGQSIFRVQSVAPNGGPRVVCFDPFLGTLNSPSITPATGQPVIAGGLIDLQQAASAGRYVRLFYPNSVAGPTAPGSVSTTSNPVLVTAQTLQELNNVTSGAQPNIATLFLGRAVAIPEIGVWVSVTMAGQAPFPPSFEYVPVGTTVGHIVERYAPLPLDLSGSTTVSLQRLSTISGGAIVAVFGGQFGSAPPLPASSFDLPLIAGDVVLLQL